ncbi:MAG: hypothetical protein QOJ00_1835 [Actinomycetota bacterium]|jgi:hypothetical protein
MTLRVVGAGLGRTGTNSLMAALETLLGGQCHHMMKVFVDDQGATWRDIVLEDNTALLDELMTNYVASVDWPSCAYWEHLADANPDALILLSTRATGEEWFKSASDTIFALLPDAPDSPWKEMVQDLIVQKFAGGDLTDKAACIAAYEAHNEHVRQNADPARLLEWQASDGWEPICARLGLPVPAEPFPHNNSTEEFLSRSSDAD